MLGVDICVVNWNSGKSIIDCIQSVLGGDNQACYVNSIIIVDNASRDKLKHLENVDSERLVRVYNEKNVGFAKGCNQAAQKAKADFVLFLNPDVVLEPSALSRAAEALEADPTIGVVGISLKDETGEVSKSCARFPSASNFLAQSVGLDRLIPSICRPHFMTEWDHRDTRFVDQVMGAFMLMRRVDFLRLGGFDERFFLYMEDVDLSLRASQIGLKSIHLSSASAIHTGCGSTNAIPILRTLYSIRSRLQYAQKHFGTLHILISAIALLGLEPLARIGKLLVSGKVSQGLRMTRVWWWLVSKYPYADEKYQGEQSLIDWR